MGCLRRCVSCDVFCPRPLRCHHCREGRLKRHGGVRSTEVYRQEEIETDRPRARQQPLLSFVGPPCGK
eukprot:139664-Pleurochrysis_carterae.AAC.1